MPRGHHARGVWEIMSEYSMSRVRASCAQVHTLFKQDGAHSGWLSRRRQVPEPGVLRRRWGPGACRGWRARRLAPRRRSTRLLTRQSRLAGAWRGTWEMDGGGVPARSSGNPLSPGAQAAAPKLVPNL
jgi:hypothetical protein